VAADTDSPPPAPAPAETFEVLERARHALLLMPDGSGLLYRAGPLCERCETCGCGEQQPPLPVPAFAVKILRGEGIEGLPGPLRAMLGRMSNGHNRD